MSAHVSWKELSEAYAFVGNSLLKPMTQTSDVGLDPAFWKAFPTFGSPDVAGACTDLAAYAHAAREAAASDGCDPVERCAVEYTRLFVGPPSPAAPPWETMHRGGAAAGGAAVGFGEATFDMRRRLREAGLEVRNENNQYEDHMGIELLYLSVLCARAAEERGALAAKGGSSASDEVVSFIETHLLAWLSSLCIAVEDAAPSGYFSRLLALADALLHVPLKEGQARRKLFAEDAESGK
ncbi:hypothetical protein B5F40_02520 [Gordonibacter sp. An230]|uniref:TorD/DmsD family molecular chaperone n=1 Tax=Gordonibacter sp. An230 TaxID=1965592 RepID=UPI000B37ECA9|nr:molecular chaperone TorD family protein [Gordonibacter sp. An230]OUO91731.1 hypothetical protein B5F40_02520 [Gordonibacter sp. An230]